MDKKTKFEYIKTVEEYLEENSNPSSDSEYFTHVYEMFTNLQKQLLIHRPEKPLDFLIDRLGKRDATRIFIVGPPGSNAKTFATALSEQFLFDKISIGSILTSEAEKKGDLGKKIAEKITDCRFVEDEISIAAIKGKIPHGVDGEHSFIMEGFPRNKVQALQLQKLGITPDKFILLDVPKEVSLKRIEETLIKHGTPLQGEELRQAAEIALTEYNMNIAGVKEAYEGFLYNCSVEPESVAETTDILKRMVQVKLNSPKRPPRIIILGPPGSGRATQARALSKRYGLVHVSTMQLLRDEISKKTERGSTISKSIQNGELVPDDLIMSIIERRLSQTDCKVNGWVMDGFPKTLQQVTLLKTMKIKPSRVVLLECSEEGSVKRLKERQVDPITGIYYNVQNLPEEVEVKSRLIQHPEDKEDTVRKRWRVWDDFIGKIEEVYSHYIYNVRAESQTAEEITDCLAEIIQNPARA